jgi:predicted dehydrogenase
MDVTLTRRNFVKASVAASTLFSILPPKIIGANERVNLACIGTQGQGKQNMLWMHHTGLANIVAQCDVDRTHWLQKELAEPKQPSGYNSTDPFHSLIEAIHDVPKFQDFRKMFDKIANQIDAVCISVPDHSHFPIAMLAMSLGKHVYVEKPLANTFHEVQLLMAAEKNYQVAAQMGNQGHSGNNPVQFKSWVEAGIIKNVRHVDAYMNKPRQWHGWEINGYPKDETLPETIDWDMWIGVAPYHDYSKKYVDGNWRSWYEYGNGAIGDWAPHTIDTVHRYLNLGLPTEIDVMKLEGPNPYIFPKASTLSFHFPSRSETMPAMNITWYDGTNNLPPRPNELEQGRTLGECGKIIYSDDLVFKGGTHSDTLRIIPEEKMKAIIDHLPRITEKQSDHATNFLLACKGQEKTRSSFDVAGPLTQVCLLGVIAQRIGGKLVFNPETQQFTNNKAANHLLVGPPPRKEWEEFYVL